MPGIKMSGNHCRSSFAPYTAVADYAEQAASAPVAEHVCSIWQLSPTCEGRHLPCTAIAPGHPSTALTASPAAELHAAVTHLPFPPHAQGTSAQASGSCCRCCWHCCWHLCCCLEPVAAEAQLLPV
jgi:hypothetical protein